MTSKERVVAAINFETPDRLPRWDNFHVFGDWPRLWQEWKGFSPDVDPADYYQTDVEMCIGDDGPLFSQRAFLRKDGEFEVHRSSWGKVYRQKPGDAWFWETIEAPLDDPRNLDRLKFEDPADPDRFERLDRKVKEANRKGRMSFGKVGGIYRRTEGLRREEDLLMDMAMDEGFCSELFGRAAEYLTLYGLEVARRGDFFDRGLFVYDDCCSSHGPIFSPTMWDRYFLPLYRKMIQTFRDNGVRHVYFHSDGNIAPLIDGLLAAGFEGLNPLEPRCGLDLVALREKYGKRIVFFGGICNTVIMPSGDKAEIERMVRPLIELGEEGGLIVGMAELGEDIAPEAYDYYISLLDKYAVYG